MPIRILIYGGLALVSAGSMLIKRPWTIIIARRSTPPEVWPTDLFLETNMIITGGWVFLFAAAAVLVVYAPLSVNIAYGILMFVLGALSGRFGHWYSSRRLKAMGLLDLDQPPPDDQAGAA